MSYFGGFNGRKKKKPFYKLRHFFPQTYDLAPSAALINSNFKTMMNLPPNHYVSVNWSFLDFVLISHLWH